ncbi:MAG: hypothetical protein WC905_03785 [Patescibacteria group bacterium]|jgi:hypothetical protein
MQDKHKSSEEQKIKQIEVVIGNLELLAKKMENILQNVSDSIDTNNILFKDIIEREKQNEDKRGIE